MKMLNEMSSGRLGKWSIDIVSSVLLILFVIVSEIKIPGWFAAIAIAWTMFLIVYSLVKIYRLNRQAKEEHRCTTDTRT